MNESSQQKPVCVITGGTSGIGLATAIRFASEGYDIAICGRRSNKLSEAQREIENAGKLHAVRCFAQVVDLNEVPQAQEFGRNVIEEFRSIDVLVNNAASARLANFEEISADDFETAINTNLRSLFFLTQLVWAQMKRQATQAGGSPGRNHLGEGRGVIVNISSLAAVDPFPGFSLYGACKAWLDLLTVALSAEGQELGLRVFSIRPGAVETPLLRGLFPDFPAEQCVSPEQVANAVIGCVKNPDKFPSGQAFEITAQPIKPSK